MSAARAGRAALLLFIASAPFLVPQFYITVLNYIGLASVVTLGLVLLTGVGGLISFGQAAFVGIGAYTTAYLTTVYGVPPWITLPMALAVTSAVALLLGLATVRLSGHYLPLATIAWGIAIYNLFGNVEWLGQFAGLTGVPPVTVFGLVLDSPRSFYYLIWLAVLIAMWTITNLLCSRPGRAIRALPGRSLMAEAFGVNTAAYKLAIFLYAALLASISGWLYAHLLRFVSPTPFGLNGGIEYLFMVVIGGSAHVMGAILGAALFVILNQWLQELLPKLTGTTGNFEIIVFGVLMVLLMQRTRGGIVPLLRRIWPPPPDIPVPASAPLLKERPRPTPGGELLAVESVCKEFGGLIAVNDVSFALRSGELLGLIGPNGAGKSTLFNMITGVINATRGQIVFCGKRIDHLLARDIIRSGIARTFQHVQIRSTMTVVENVALGAHLRGRAGLVSAALHLDRAEESSLLFEARRQLERLGLGNRLYDSAGDLALGQQRILEIARALAADPILLLLDEPAAGLRYKEKQALADLLRQVRQEGMSIIVVEHDMEFVMNLVDRLVVMDSGAKIAEGPPKQIQNNPRVVEAYLGSPGD